MGAGSAGRMPARSSAAIPVPPRYGQADFSASPERHTGRVPAVLLALLATPEEDGVAALSIRGLDDDVRERLRVRAARHGRSMEAEIRAILVEAVREPAPAASLFTELLDRFGEIGGVELELPPRATPPRAVDLSA